TLAGTPPLSAVGLLPTSSRTSLDEDSENGKREGGNRKQRHSQIPSWRNCAVAVPAQSLFEAGQAGLGCKILPTWGRESAITSRARFPAKSPTPMSHSGSKIRTISRKCLSQAANRAVRSFGGSLSGVRLRPLFSQNASGQ